MQSPARYLILIASDGAMLARLFDAQRVQRAEFDAASEEVAVMTAGLAPGTDALDAVWDRPLAGHSATERAAAQVYTLDV
ncbi:MAG TPA: hypothetical protein VNV16_00215 [Methylibium sp.]|jgi:hypothetical protein|nr:hypothetical protein [Methylibium sp.]